MTQYTKRMYCGCALVRWLSFDRVDTGLCVSERYQIAAVTAMQLPPQADKVKRPILLIHGEDDNNTGTFPMQVLPLSLALLCRRL